MVRSIYRNDPEEFYNLKKLLNDEGISAKFVASNPNSKRMFGNILLGGEPLILNTFGMRASNLEEYKIFVKKENEYNAKYLIQKYKQNNLQ